MSSPVKPLNSDGRLDWDVVVIGSGHAGSCAAHAAVDAGVPGPRVLVLDKCPPEWVGGNGYFTAGAHRTTHGGLHDLLPLVSNVSPELVPKIDVPPYTSSQFSDDIFRMGEGRNAEGLVKTVVEGSRDAVQWLKDRVGVDFTLSFNRQAYVVDGVQRFWGGMALSTRDGGKGLIRAHRNALERANVQTWFESRAIELIQEDGRITGVVVEKDGKTVVVRAKAVVLAAGGFEASREEREKHLGKAWSEARVRGTPYNTGDGIRMAAAAGARLQGDFAGCHSTCWDASAAPDQGSRELSNQYTKSGYPLGIMVNANGERFVDEGVDFRNYTYAVYGRAILNEPRGYAFQIFDQKGVKWLREEEYGDGVIEKIWAEDIEQLADEMRPCGLIHRLRFQRTVREYNEAVHNEQEKHPERVWDPTVKDGISTGDGLSVRKSNWALSLEEGPFLAVKVSCGITFTFGGVAIDPATAAVLSEDGKSIEGLFATGEMVGGLFYGNYPGGSGLTAGAVFGRHAGREAARIVEKLSAAVELADNS
ncbi:FAD binding domain-containing protein [Vararia minispora EC-137]|uniref:FAD binding domain-containing protein n=1 Tax=Vararia minispora EC-137 TaxID=1314806 RepID=A0ACB8QXC3_9AGAM|nr:FAD binding domain-containing protein [Vararia minispora EC-137]